MKNLFTVKSSVLLSKLQTSNAYSRMGMHLYITGTMVHKAHRYTNKNIRTVFKGSLRGSIPNWRYQVTFMQMTLNRFFSVIHGIKLKGLIPESWSDNYTTRNKENVPNLLGVNLLIFHCTPELFRRYHAVFVHVKFLKYGKQKKTN